MQCQTLVSWSINLKLDAEYVSLVLVSTWNLIRNELETDFMFNLNSAGTCGGREETGEWSHRSQTSKSLSLFSCFLELRIWLFGLIDLFGCLWRAENWQDVCSFHWTNSWDSAAIHWKRSFPIRFWGKCYQPNLTRISSNELIFTARGHGLFSS